MKLRLTTHAIGALSLPDFILATKIDAITVDYSPAWLSKNPAAASSWWG